MRQVKKLAANGQAEEVRCLCGSTSTDQTPIGFSGLWLQCDRCKRWQHGNCVGHPTTAPKGRSGSMPFAEHGVACLPWTKKEPTGRVWPPSYWERIEEKHVRSGASLTSWRLLATNVDSVSCKMDSACIFAGSQEINTAALRICALQGAMSATPA